MHGLWRSATEKSGCANTALVDDQRKQIRELKRRIKELK